MYKKKDVVAPASYYVSFKINDSVINHTGVNFCSLKPNISIPGNYGFLYSSSNSTSIVTMTLSNNGTIGTGTYTTGSANSYLNAEYFLNEKQIEYATQTTNSPQSPFSVSLTEINQENIKGTFTGTYLYNDNRTDSLRISDGKFFIRRTK